MARRYDYPKRLTLPRIKEKRLSLGYSTITNDGEQLTAGGSEQQLSITGGVGITVSGVEGNPDSLVIDGLGMGATILHSDLQNLGIPYDDHEQYSLISGTRSYIDTVTIEGSKDANQLIVKAAPFQSNSNPMIELRLFDGTPVYALTSDHASNIFLGVDSGLANEGGTNLLFLGADSGKANTTGSQNTFIGADAGESNTIGFDNLAIGATAMRENIDGDQNICIGRAAGLGVEGNSYTGNVFIGVSSGAAVTTGGSNTGIGATSLAKLTTGQSNVGIGAAAVNGVTDGFRNVGIGQSSLLYRGSGDDSVAIGVFAGLWSTGDDNVNIGGSSGQGSSGSTYNSSVIIGYRSGFALTTGDDNILVGYKAGDNLTTGGANIIIGYDLNASAVGVSNELNIGGLITGDTSAKTVHLDGDTTVAGFVETPKCKMTDIGGYAVKLLNKTGSASVVGTIVEASTNTDLAFETTAADDDMPIGVVYEAGIADGAECFVVVAGVAEVLLENNTAATRGYWARTSTTTGGRADITNATPPGGTFPAIADHLSEIGHCLETVASGIDVTAKCLIRFN